jgi:hypothetical protein
MAQFRPLLNQLSDVLRDIQKTKEIATGLDGKPERDSIVRHLCQHEERIRVAQKRIERASRAEVKIVPDEWDG